MLYFALRVFPGAQMKEYAAKLLAALFAGQEPDILPSFVKRAKEVSGSVWWMYYKHTDAIYAEMFK